MYRLHVTDFGACGDGVHDDTAAIQAAISYIADHGGVGTVYFPFTPNGYRIASAGIPEADGAPLRAQLCIPASVRNLALVGELPCNVLNAYLVRPSESAAKNYTPTTFGRPAVSNTVLFSDWDAPEVHDPKERPWAILAAPQGCSLKGRFSVPMVTLQNLEFRVRMDRDRMYPTQSAVNLQNVSRVHVEDCHFCLDEQVGDTLLQKQLLENPCQTVGLMTSGDQNDDQVLRNVAVQGFKYGLVCGEHVAADYLYLHNCEYALCFHDSSHLSTVQHIVAQHNTRILAALPDGTFGHAAGPCNVDIGALNLESGRGLRPEISALQYGVWDPDDRLRGYLRWFIPWGDQSFPVLGASRMHISHWGD